MSGQSLKPESGAEHMHFDPVITRQQSQVIQPEDGVSTSNDAASKISPTTSGQYYVQKILTYATALPNTPEKMMIANQIAQGFEAIARARTSSAWIHMAFNERRMSDKALTARLDKTTVRSSLTVSERG